MCKVLAIAGIREGQHDIIKKIAIAAVDEFHTQDGDGFGYAAITEKGDIYGEKWLRKQDAFVLHQNAAAPRSALMIDSVLGNAAKLPELPTNPTYAQFGVPITKEAKDTTVAFMMHARKATIGEKSVMNTHPFYHPEDKTNEPTALIHNGGIRNHEKLTKMFSTCDSETILHEYLRQAINYVPTLIDQVANTLVGEYTSVVLSRYVNEDQVLQPYMDIFKSNKELYVGYVKELDNLLFCTNKFALERICKACDLTLEDATEVDDGYLVRLDAITGERIDEVVEFAKSRQYEGVHNLGNHSGRTVGPAATQNMAEIKKVPPTINQYKKDFATNHPEVFGTQYMTLEPMTDEDQVLLAEFEEANDNSNLRALALVQSSVATRG